MTRLLDTNPATRITVDDVINDPWFRVDYKQVQFHEEYLELKDDYDDDDDDVSNDGDGGGGGDNLKMMNAFDI
ncbi:CBL-interacting serine/threonine-protein kinase 14-like protein, partial [Tanacetum coccineum]